MSAACVAEIADWLHPAASVWKALAMLKAYFDETGTHDDSTITAIGGFVGTKAAWEGVEPAWLGVLKGYESKGVRFFHTAEALAQEGQFALIDKPNVNYIVTQCAQALGEAPLEPFFSAVVIEDWDRVVHWNPDFLERFPHPIDLCFENLVQTLWWWGKQYAGGEPIAPVFAYHKEFSPRMAEIGRVYGAQDWYRTVLGPIAFDYPERTWPLQAADLLAHQMNWDVENRAYDREFTGETKALYWATGGRHIRGNWFDEQGLLLTIKRFRETGGI